MHAPRALFWLQPLGWNGCRIVLGLFFGLFCRLMCWRVRLRPPGGAPRCPPHGGQAEWGWFFVPPSGRLFHAGRRHLLPAERAGGVCSLLLRAELSARFRAGVLAGLKAGR